MLRSLLGLDQQNDASDTSAIPKDDDDSFFQHEDDSEEGFFQQDNGCQEITNPIDSEEEKEGGVDKEFKFIPGMQKLEDKIRNTINERKVSGNRDHQELTPWEKYQLKRKEKRKEKKKQSKERRETFIQETRGGSSLAHEKDKDTSLALAASKNELDLLMDGDDGKLSLCILLHS
jgi:hypothetical protein